MATFAREFRATFQTTGAILPSGRPLARAITRFAVAAPRPARLLEVGPGTGAFTDALIRSLAEQDRLTIVELNPRFVDALRRRLETDPAWRPKADRVELVHDSIEHFGGGEKFSAVVCGLPFNNFPPELTDRLMNRMLGLAIETGTLSFFEYLAIRRLKSPFVGRQERDRLANVAAVLDGYLNRRRIATDRVFRNVPPAAAHHLRAG